MCCIARERDPNWVSQLGFTNINFSKFCFFLFHVAHVSAALITCASPSAASGVPGGGGVALGARRWCPVRGLCVRDTGNEQSRSQYVHHFCDGVTTLINHISAAPDRLRLLS